MNIPHCIKASIRLDQVQFDKMKSLKIQNEPDDGWFIYYEDNWLYFFGSQTGYLIFKCKIHHNGSKFEIRDFYAERDIKMYGNTDDLKDIQEMRRLSRVLTLAVQNHLTAPVHT